MLNILESLKPIGEHFKSGNFRDAAEAVERIWSGLPEAKADVQNAYLLVEYAVAVYMKLNELEAAWRWACMGSMFNEKRHDLGESEFLKGKVAYEMGNIDVARENFLFAQEKSQGRIFQGQDKKYKKLIAANTNG